MPFTNPIVAGTTLIRTAIHSPDYIAGISGWSINKDGTAEFNDVTVRGTVEAGSGTVVLNDQGLSVQSSSLGFEYIINRSAGFYARNSPDDGEHVQMYPAGIAFSSKSPTVNGNNMGVAQVFQAMGTVGGVERPQLQINSQTINGQNGCHILLEGIDTAGAVAKETLETHGGEILLNSLHTYIQDRLISSDTGMDYPAAQCFNQNFSITGNGGTGQQNLNLGNTNYPVAFPAGYTLFGYANLKTTAGASVGWQPRWFDISNSQFNLNMYHPLGGAAGTTIMVVNVTVFIVPA